MFKVKSNFHRNFNVIRRKLNRESFFLKGGDMSCQECCKREKLFQYRIKGQNHPFVDANLQLRLPGQEISMEDQDLALNHPVYAYYSSYFVSSIYPSPLSDSEMEQAMAEAQKAYEMWKQSQEQLEEAIGQI